MTDSDRVLDALTVSSTTSTAFDPYDQWLGIPRHEQPANYYRLLGIARFDDNPERIEAAADERMILIRKHQTGPRGTLTQPLLNELAAARNCLLAPEAKAAYDEQLRQQGTPAPLARVVSPPVGARLPVAPVPVPAQRIVEPPLTAPPLPITPPSETSAAASAESDIEESETSTIGPLAIGFLGMAAAAMLVAGATFGIGRLLWQRSNADHSQPPVTKRTDSEVNPGEINPDSDTRLEIAAGQMTPPRNAVVVMQEGSRDVHLSPATAALTGDVKLKSTGGDELLDQWSRDGDAATWLFKILRPGFFQLELTYASQDEAGEIRMAAILDDKEVGTFTLRPSGAMDRFATRQHTLALASSGQHTLEIRLQEDVESVGFQLRLVRLIPVGADGAERK